MKFEQRIVFLACSAMMLAQTIFAQLPEKGAANTFYQEREIEKKVEKLMKKMTLDEKIGQLVLFAGRGVVTGPTGSVNTEEYIKDGMCGGVFNIKDINEVIRFQKMAVEDSRLGIPLLFGFDMIHGFKTIYPVNIGISASWNIPLIEKYAQLSAAEAAAGGVHWTFSPMCDISHDPRWGRVSEGAGEDPFLASHVSSAMVRGYQGANLHNRSSIMACVKHFAGYGASQAGRDYHTVDMSDRMFRNLYLPPYQAALDAGAATVMTSFNDYDGEPVTINKYLMQDLLRDEIGFNGFVVTDYTTINELVPHGVARDYKHGAELSLNNRVNMDMVSNTYLLFGKQLVEEGKVSKNTIDVLCAEILGMKYRLGLFDDPYRYCPNTENDALFYTEESLQTAHELARSSMVLLQNNNNTLPLNPTQKIALVGPFANAAREMLGSWVISGNPKKTTTFLKGIEERFGADQVLFAEGCKPDKHIEGGLTKAIAAAEESDIICVTLGHPQAWTGEATSLTSLDLPKVQIELLEKLEATGKPIVVLLVAARPLNISEQLPLADAILLTWNPGTMAGQAVADILSGDYNPSGKITMTFPRNVGQIPIHYNMKNTGRPLGFQSMSSQKYTSRYMFTPNTPQFCFGYGLSYTTFAYNNLKVETPSVKIGDNVRITVEVTNTGKVAGEEVAQLYIRDLVASVTRPVRELKGFQKIHLEVGETKKLEFTLTPAELELYRQDKTYGQETGDYHVWVGTNSDATLQSEFEITKN